MRVLHVAATYHPATAYGGPAVSVHQLVLAEVALGATVRVLTTDADGRRRMRRGKAVWGGAEVEYWPARPLNSHGVSPSLWGAILSSVREYDVVHMHGVFLPSTTVGLWACRWSDIPSVLSPHGAMMRWAIGQRRWRKRLYAPLDRTPLSRAMLHATSEAEAGDLRGLGFRHVIVVPNGVDQAYFGEPSSLNIRSCFGLRSDAALVAWIGRFAEVKNLEVLIDATRDLGVQLVLAGHNDTAYGHALREKVRGESRSDVHFVGHVDGDRKRALLQQAALYAHPSLMESYGMSIVEALAAGTPVVASHGTPWGEIEAAGAGRWVEPNVDDIRNAIRSVLAEDRVRLRRAAKAVAARHGWEDRARDMLELYRHAIQGGYCEASSR